MHVHPDHPSSASLLDWFTGGANHRYMTLIHCMDGDKLWIGLTVFLDVAVAAGYLVIALHWWRNQRTLQDGPARQALGRMRNIFVFCGLCGYIFIPIKMVWPAWRLYDVLLAILVYFTWRYAWGARELKVLYSELNRSERLASDLEASRAESRRKSSFLNAVSHDLRTPLNGLMLQTDLAQISVESNDTQSLREALAEIKANARVAADLLNRFLELGRLDWTHEQNHVVAIDLIPLLHQVIHRHQAVADRKGLYLRFEGPQSLFLGTDALKVERILENLLSNAIKYTEAGGVTLRVERACASQIRIQVMDTGVGIAPEHQHRLFEEFYQVHNHERDRNKGYGLGLAISRRLARQLGGDLVASSEPGRGSCFSVTLREGSPSGTSAPAHESGNARCAEQASSAAG